MAWLKEKWAKLPSYLREFRRCGDHRHNAFFSPCGTIAILGWCGVDVVAKPFRCRVALAQISANPAYADELVACIQEPFFPEEDQKLGLVTVSGIQEIAQVRQRIAAEYIDHITRKCEAVARFAASKRAEILVFPEYSIPPETLPICRQLADELGLVIVAGSHVVTNNSSSIQAYRAAGIQFNSDPLHGGPQVRQAICTLFLQGREPLVFPKHVLSKWESTLVPGAPATHSVEVQFKRGRAEVQVLICIEAIVDKPPGKEKHTLPRLVVVSAFTPSTEPFQNQAALFLLSGKCTVFANIADFGGSKIYARAEKTNLWFTERDGSKPIPKSSEGVLIAELDLEKQFEVRKSSAEHTAVNDLRLYPLLYVRDSEETRQYYEYVQSMAAVAAPVRLDEIAQKVRPFIDLNHRVFPELLQQKLSHFVSHVINAGTVTESELCVWLEPVAIANTSSTQALRWRLCSEAMNCINELITSGRHVERNDDMLKIYGLLIRKRNEIGTTIVPPAISDLQRAQPELPFVRESGPGFEAPFIDRDASVERVRRFLTQPAEPALIISGMRGIGKTALMHAAFRQIIPVVWRRIWIQLTEGMSYARLLTELAYKCNVWIPPDAEPPTPEGQASLEKRILSNLSQGVGAVVVLDEFQNLLNLGGEIEDPAVEQLIVKLVLGSAENKARSKYFFISHVATRLPADITPVCSRYSLQGLLNTDAEKLFLYWYQAAIHDLSRTAASLPERFLALLGGHPLAVRIGAALWAQAPAEDPAREGSVFDQLRETVVPFIIEKLPLSEAEEAFLTFASVLRLPASREVFLRWRGDEGGFLLDSLSSQYLVEATQAGYQLHPLVREYFYRRAQTQELIFCHRIVAKFYLEIFEKARTTRRQLIPEYLGEAVHHFLAAGESRKVQSFSLYRPELRPVALSHYRRGDYELALKDYRILVALDDADADAHFHLALIHGRKNKWGDAELHFEKARSLKPTAHWILQGFGSAKLRANKLAEAERLLLQALALSPEHAPTLVDLGRLRERQEDLGAADEFYRKAIDCDPNNSFAYYQMAKLMYRLGYVDDAYRYARLALSTDPLDYRNKALVKELKGKIQARDAATQG